VTATENIFLRRTVDTFSTCSANFRLRKYAPCGPTLIALSDSRPSTFAGHDRDLADAFLVLNIVSHKISAPK